MPGSASPAAPDDRGGGRARPVYGLPVDTPLRYERPGPGLNGYLTDYHLLDADPPANGETSACMLPNWPAIRVILSDQPIAVTLAGRRYDPVPRAALFGATSRATDVTGRGGLTIGVGISPLGWSRLFRDKAAAYRDRIVPLGELLPQAVVDELAALLRASRPGAGLRPALDGFFARYMMPVSRDEPAIRRLMGLVMDDATRDLAEAGARIGIQPHTLRRLSARYFGFSPKALLVRTRFMKVLHRMIERGEADYSAIGDGYYDLSHFLRDSRHFLGMTPRQFMAEPKPYLQAVLRSRAEVLGSAMRSLQPLDD